MSNNIFKLALEAREGKIEGEILKGAAKRIYSDKTITNDMLQDYARNREPKRTLVTQQKYATYKY